MIYIEDKIMTIDLPYEASEHVRNGAHIGIDAAIGIVRKFVILRPWSQEDRQQNQLVSDIIIAIGKVADEI